VVRGGGLKIRDEGLGVMSGVGVGVGESGE